MAKADEDLGTQINSNAAPKRKPMSEGELKAILNAKVTNSLGYYGGKLSKARVTAMQYYEGEPFGNEQDGRSQVVSRDVAEAIDSMMPSLMKIFTSGDEIVRFDPTRPGDENVANQATDYVNWIWTKQNEGFKIFFDWFKDAMLNRAGAIKIWWDEQEETAKESYEGLTDEEYLLLIEEAPDESLEILSHDEYPDPAAPPQLALPNPMAATGASPAPAAPPEAAGGLPPAAPPGQLPGMAPTAPGSAPLPSPPVAAAEPPSLPMLHDVTLRRTNKSGRIKVAPIPGEEFLMDRRAISLTETPFSCHRQKKTISDLLEMGYDYDLVKDLGEGDSSDFNLERLERFRQEDELPYRTGNNYDPSMKEVWVNECYLKVDWDGDGIAELRKITFAGEAGNLAPGSIVILDNEETDDNPFAALTPIPMPHKFYGQSIADQTMDLQLIKSTLWRTSLDHTYNAIMPQVIAIEGQVNLDDLLTRRPGGVVRAKQQGAVEPLPNGEMGVDPFQMISYIDQVREQRTGVQRFTAGPGADTLNNAYTDTATGANLVENSSQERLELIARCFAELGVKPAFLKILKLVSMHQSRPKAIRLREKWVTMDPREWDTQFDVSVTVGLGTGNRAQQLQGMQFLLQTDAQIVQQQGGLSGPLLTAENLYNKLDKVCEYIGLKGAESYYTDPASNPQPLQPHKPSPQAEAAQIKAQADQQKTQIQLQADQMKFQAQTQIDERRAQLDAQFEAQKLQMQMQAEHAKAIMQAQSQERIAMTKIQAEREVEYARIAAERQEFNAETALELHRHETDTMLKSAKLGADIEAKDKDREASSEAPAKSSMKQAPYAPLPPKAPPKVHRVTLMKGPDGFATQAHRHYDDGTSDIIHVDRVGA